MDTKRDYWPLCQHVLKSEYLPQSSSCIAGKSGVKCYMEWYYPVLCCLYACVLNWPGFQVTNPSVLYLNAKIYFCVENWIIFLFYIMRKNTSYFLKMYGLLASVVQIIRAIYLLPAQVSRLSGRLSTLAVLVELNCLFGTSLDLASSECLRVSIELFCIRGCVDTCIPHLERGDALCSWVCSDSEEVEH